MTLEEGMPLWLIYATFPDHVRAIIRHWISLMAAGMQAMLDPDETTALTWYGDVRILSTVSAYDEYCYHVAGTVGGLATELVVAHYGLTGSTRERLMAGSKACGRALQKTNIIKDFLEDLERGVCFLPNEWLREIGHMPLRLAGAPAEWTYAVLQNVLDELRAATEYVQAIPTTAAGYRIAALVCLLPAYQTILTAAQRQPHLFTQGHQVKIAREMMAYCLHDAVAMAPDNHAITDHCRKLEQTISTARLAEPDHS
jgi:farnesyl-diphosphate farnesyltransferase